MDAITSDPPLEARDLNIKPTPTPIMTPPKILAKSTSSCSCKGSGPHNKTTPSVNNAVSIKHTNVLTPNFGPNILSPISVNGKLKNKADIPTGKPNLWCKTMEIP